MLVEPLTRLRVVYKGNKMKAMKFRVRDEQHSKEIQEALFEEGYSWHIEDVKLFMLSAEYLFANVYSTNKYITYGNTYIDFQNQPCEECVVTNGVISSVACKQTQQAKNMPIGLRPKAIAEALRKVEVLEAIVRYVEAAEKVPQEWLEEFIELNGKMK